MSGETQSITFPATRYLTLRKSVAISQIADKAMYDEAGRKLGAYLQTHGLPPSGPWCVIYFRWDQEGGKTEIGISFPVQGLGEVVDPELSRVDLSESKALCLELKGSYDGLGEAHHRLNDALAERKLAYRSEAMCVEEYVVGPMEKPDPKDWLTRIVYLHG